MISVASVSHSRLPLKVYDLSGKEVETLGNDNLKPVGRYIFNASGLSSGVYFYTLRTKNFKDTDEVTGI